MRLTTRTNLAARVLMFCAVNDGRIVRTAEIAERCNASLNHLLQVVHLLQEHGFVETQRGRSGGLRLARPMAQISIGAVFRVMESGAPFAECFDAETNTCPLTATCRLRGWLKSALDAFFAELDRATLADLVQGNCGLAGLLDMAGSLQPDCSPAMG
jgi:Rrf2 family nitric oxide-sensitive transcriptional repressor